jgi:hypothetical protein
MKNFTRHDMHYGGFLHEADVASEYISIEIQNALSAIFST